FSWIRLNVTRGSRAALRALAVDDRVEISTRPLSAACTRTAEVCRSPLRRRVIRMARWVVPRNSLTWFSATSIFSACANCRIRGSWAPSERHDRKPEGQANPSTQRAGFYGEALLQQPVDERRRLP